MSGDATRTKAAIQARRNNTEQMLQRVRDALRQMRRDHIPAQTAMVARRAEVSRTFLYQNEQARKLLADAVADRPAAATACRRHDAGQGGPWKDRALNAEDALKAAYAEISSQRDQIGKLLGRIRDLEIDLPADAVRENQRGEQDAPPAEPQAHHRQSAAHRADQGRPREQPLPRHPHRPPRSRPRRIPPRRRTCARTAVLTSDEVLAFKPVSTARESSSCASVQRVTTVSPSAS